METQSKSKLLYLIIILLVVFNIGTLSFMWYRELNAPKLQDGRMPPKSGKEFLEEELKFSKEQNEKLEKLKEEHSAKIRKIKDEQKDLKDLFFSNLSKPDIDSNKISEIASQIGMSQKQVELATFYHVRKIREICDENQKKKFDVIIQDALKMGLGPGGGPDGRRPPPPDGRRPPPDGYKQKDGDGHVNPPGSPRENPPRP